jgi:glutamyl-tRNA synthetase
MKNFEEKTRAYALKNALSHDGKAVAGAVISALFNEGLKREEIGKYAKTINEIVGHINSMSSQQQEKAFSEIENFVSERESREGLPELPDVKKSGVVMRIAPSPSGPLHVMHAVVASYSYLYVKKYGGKFYARIEDTNPENIYPKAYKMIEDEVKWLFEDKPIVLIQSDRMKIYYTYAEKLIKKNSAYVCTCSTEQFKKFADAKEECKCRNNSTEENLERWNKMLDAKGFKPGEAVLRFKSSMTDPNPAMRDFPLARINLENHPRQKKKFRVWPLMNLAVAVDDIELGMTHIIRGKDHRDNAKRQEMIYNVLGKKYPWCAFIGRVNFKEMELSTSQTRKDIEAGKYKSWDDPKLPFIESLKKRGYKPEAFWKMAEHMGISEVDKVISLKDFFTLLDNFNKEIENEK